jgi:hypothetical protein
LGCEQSSPFRTYSLFWDLNYSLGCSPFAHPPYGETPSPDFDRVGTFGVGRTTEPFRVLNHQSVSLPRPLPPSRLDCGQLQLEPAIADLDWLFTPIPRLEEQLLLAPLQASTRFYSDFTLPRNRSTGFGSDPSDLWHFHTTPLIACGLLVSLQLLLYGLALPLRLTPWLVFQNERSTSLRYSLSLLGLEFFALPVRGSFQLSLAVLVRYRSQGVFKVGS